MESRKTNLKGFKEPPIQIGIEKIRNYLIEEFGKARPLNSQPSQPATISNPSLSSGNSMRNESGVRESVNKIPSTSGEGKRVHTVLMQQNNTECKRAKRDDINPELRFRCSFCAQRFPSLTNVRDHTRACHREENERRKEEKLNSRNLEVVPELRVKSNQNPENKHINLFKCIACKFASISYNHMIEHCQNHVMDFANQEANTLSIPTTRSVICGEEFFIDFDTHTECNNGLNHSYTFIDCDYKLLNYDKWPGLYGNMPKSEVDKINCTSMYYFTRIIRLRSVEVDNSSSVPYMVFQCQKCMKYIDPHSILKHVQENSCSANLSDFPCYVCKKPFLNENTMYLHYKLHKVASTSNIKFRTILFNNGNDDVDNLLLLKAAGLNMQNVPSEKIISLQKLLSKSPKTKIKVINSQITYIPKTVVNYQNKPSGSNVQLKDIKNDARSMIIQGTKTDASNKIVSEASIEKEKDKVPTVYKCKCELCFHELDILFKHLENCHLDYKGDVISCVCGLLFNEKQYQIHHMIHSHGFMKLNVKKLSVCVEKAVVLNNKHNKLVENKVKELEYNELYGKAVEKVIRAICNVLLGLENVNSFKKKEIPALIAAKTTRTVGTGTDDLIIAVSKSRGTMTLTETPTIREVINTKDRGETKSVGSGSDDLNLTVMKSQETMTIPEVKHANATKSVGTGTDDLIVKVMKSQETMTIPKVKHVNATKSVGTGTDDLMVKLMKRQETMIIPETQTVREVNKVVGNIKHVCETKSVGTETDELITKVMKTQETMTISQAQTIHEVNKDLGNNSVGSGTYDLNSTVTKSLGTMNLLEAQSVRDVKKDIDDTKKEETSILSLSVTDRPNLSLNKPKEMSISDSHIAETRSQFKNVIDGFNNLLEKVNENLKSKSDNKDENVSIDKTTIESRIEAEKTIVHCGTESTSRNFITNRIFNVMNQDYHNKSLFKDRDQINKAPNVNPNQEEGKQNEFKETKKFYERKDVIKPVQLNVEKKIYTEDELLNGPETPIYFDAEESVLTDDEDPILLYEDDTDD